MSRMADLIGFAVMAGYRQDEEIWIYEVQHNLI